LSKAFSASIEMIEIFVLDFDYGLYYIYFEPTLHPWNEISFIMVYELFNVLLNSVCRYFKFLFIGTGV
jgi:hypothetical protein